MNKKLYILPTKDSTIITKDTSNTSPHSKLLFLAKTLDLTGLNGKQPMKGIFPA